MIIKNRILEYIHIYDPVKFSLIYSTKAMIAIFISVIISYYFFSAPLMVWAVLTPMYVFFLNSSISDKSTKVIYLILFVLISVFSVFIFSVVANIGYGSYLFIPASIFAFIVGISSAYSKDLQIMLTYVFINALVSCIYALSSIQISIIDGLLVVLISGSTAIIVRFLISFGKYGRFTINTFSSLILSVRDMLNNIYDDKLFIEYKLRIFEQINNLKINLNTQSAKIKDSHLIKDTRRVLFYLQRIEDICHSLASLHNYFLLNKHNKIYLDVKNEIDYNLRELSKIFTYKPPRLKRVALNRAENEDKVFISLLKIIYSKMDFFRKASNDKVKLDVIVERHNDINSFLKVFSFSNATFRYALKYSFIIAISVFIATYWKMENGIWISLCAISIIRGNMGNTREVINDYFIGTLIGFILGFFIVVLFKNTMFFVPLFLIIIFCVLYFKVYPYRFWITMVSIALVMMFSLLNDNFIYLIFERVIDICIGALLVIVVFLTVLVNKHDISVLLSFKNTISYLSTLLESVNNANGVNRPYFIQQENAYLSEYNNLSNIINYIPLEYHTIYTENDLESFVKARDNIELLNQNLMQFGNYLNSMPVTKHEQVLYDNDISILLSRFDMINKMIDGRNHFFRTDIDNGFLCEDEKCLVIISSIFKLQNELYSLLYKVVKRVGVNVA